MSHIRPVAGINDASKNASRLWSRQSQRGLNVIVPVRDVTCTYNTNALQRDANAKEVVDDVMRVIRNRASR